MYSLSCQKPIPVYTDITLFLNQRLQVSCWYGSLSEVCFVHFVGVIVTFSEAGYNQI